MGRDLQKLAQYKYTQWYNLYNVLKKYVNLYFLFLNDKIT